MSALELFHTRGRAVGRWESSNARISSFSLPENCKMSAFELFQSRGRAWALGKFNRTHFELFAA